MSEVRHGRTLEQWYAEIRIILGVRRNATPDRIEDTLDGQPCWDYWSSGYAPQDAAKEMSLARKTHSRS